MDVIRKKPKEKADSGIANAAQATGGMASGMNQGGGGMMGMQQAPAAF